MIANASGPGELDRYDRLTVTTPCQMDWYKMEGDERVRFCDLCQRNVYNLVQLSRPEIDKIWQEEPERICARMIKDTNGRLFTKEWKAEPKYRRFQFSIWFLFLLMTAAAPLAAISPTAYRITKGHLHSWFGNSATVGVMVPQTNVMVPQTNVVGEMMMGGATVPEVDEPPGQ